MGRSNLCLRRSTQSSGIALAIALAIAAARNRGADKIYENGSGDIFATTNRRRRLVPAAAPDPAFPDPGRALGTGPAAAASAAALVAPLAPP